MKIRRNSHCRYSRNACERFNIVSTFGQTEGVTVSSVYGAVLPYRALSANRGGRILYFERKNKMRLRKSAAAVLSVIIAATMLFGCVSTAFAAGDGGIDVEVSFYDEKYVIFPTEINVSDGTAEEYGYTVSESDHNGNTVDYVTVLDVLTAAHKAYYGDAFTVETSGNYLAFSKGMITKLFGVATSSSGFTVNDATPNDGIYNDVYYSYTGYAADTAPVANGDKVSFFTYKDSYWSDYYTSFDFAEKTVSVGDTVDFTVTGYSIVWYGCSTLEAIAAATVPMSGLSLNMTSDFENSEAVAVLDENGKASYTFTQAGEYYFFTSGDYSDGKTSTPAISNICKVTVSEKNEPEEEAEKNFYIIKKIKLDFNADSDNGKLELNIGFTLKDIMGNSADREEVVTLTLSVSWISRVIEFIQSVIGG